ncbi:MAG: hypothetical protein AAF581_18420 [Planctomycetota bacterium]
MLVLVYSDKWKDDCCAANFERAVFKTEKVVNYSKQFDCYKFSAFGTSPIFRKFKLNKKKPAMLLLDAEGGLIHKQQKCINPGDYLKIMKSGFSMNAKRVKLRARYVKMRDEIRSQMDAKAYAKALRDIDRALKKREFLMGDVIAMLESDRKEIEDVGQEMFQRAVSLQENDKFEEALDLFKQIKREFRKVKKLSDDASRCAKDVTKAMKALTS